MRSGVEYLIRYPAQRKVDYGAMSGITNKDRFDPAARDQRTVKFCGLAAPPVAEPEAGANRAGHRTVPRVSRLRSNGRTRFSDPIGNCITNVHFYAAIGLPDAEVLAALMLKFYLSRLAHQAQVL